MRISDWSSDVCSSDLPTAADGMRSRQELLDRYAAASGRDLSQIDYYVAFGYWKLACIVEGVYARYVGGSMGTRDSSDFDGFKHQVESLAAQARRSEERRVGKEWVSTCRSRWWPYN